MGQNSLSRRDFLKTSGALIAPRDVAPVRGRSNIPKFDAAMSANVTNRQRRVCSRRCRQRFVLTLVEHATVKRSVNAVR